MVRYCPSCKIKLGSYDHYFCSECGFTLDDSLVQRENVFERVANFAASSEKTFSKPMLTKLLSSISFKLTSRVIVYSLVFTLAALSFLYLLFSGTIRDLVKKAPTLNVTSNTPEINIESAVETTLSWNSAVPKESLLQSVPFDATFVLDGFDAQKFGNLYKEIDLAYIDLVEYLAPNVNSHFLFFAFEENTDLAWSLLLIPNDPKLTISGELIQKYPWLKIAKSDPILIISPSSNVVEQVLEAKSSRSKNFTHTTVYNRYKAQSTGASKATLYFTGSNIRDYLLNANLPADIRLVIESVIKTNSDFVVVK